MSSGGSPFSLDSAPGWPDVRVAAVWLPQLSLRVEVLRHPAWDGRPLVLGGGPGERKVIQLCSAEAEQAGLRPGLPLREVLPLCAEAIVIQPDPVRVAATLEAIVDRLQQVSPAVEPAGEELFLDLRGLRAFYEADLRLLEQAIRQVVPGLLRPRIGVGAGKYVAGVAARQAPPGGLQVVSAERTVDFLTPLPVDRLPLEPAVLNRLELLGLRQIGDLAELPFAAVQAQLGPAGARAWRLAHGTDEEPVFPHRPKPTVRAAARFDDPLVSVEAVTAALDQLLAQAFANSLLSGRSLRQVRLRALLTDGTSWERLFTFKEALASRTGARQALQAKLQLPGGLPPAPIEELALELLGLGGEAARQGNLFTTHARQLGEIAEAARQLRARYGRVPLYHAVEVEPWSRIPERRWALVTCDL